VCHLDSYDETDVVPEFPTESASSDVELHFTQTDNPEPLPSYADFLIAYPTQSCKFNIACECLNRDNEFYEKNSVVCVFFVLCSL